MDGAPSRHRGRAEDPEILKNGWRAPGSSPTSSASADAREASR
jgi:hypothetical protein